MDTPIGGKWKQDEVSGNGLYVEGFYFIFQVFHFGRCRGITYERETHRHIRWKT